MPSDDRDRCEGLEFYVIALCCVASVPSRLLDLEADFRLRINIYIIEVKTVTPRAFLLNIIIS